MRYLSSLLFLLVGLTTNIPVYAQNVIINEDFSDGNYTNNPAWTDRESKYIVNESNLLQLNAPSATDEAVIITPSTAAYGEWEALIELGFNPSGSNLAKFFIVTNSQNLQGDLNGYYIKIGGTDDEVSLYRQDGNSSTKIIDGTDGLVDSDPVSVRIKATRDLDGNWELLADASGETAFTSQGTVTDETYASSNFIGLLSDYTSTRSDLFEYDDIKVTKITPPLEIQSASAVANQTIDITFNLDLDPSSVSASDFTINNAIGAPDATSLPSSNVVRLNYNSPLPSNQYTLTVSNVDDTNGNTINQNTTAPFILFGNFEQGDVVINEFIYDPPGGQSEYVEIINTSSKYLDLSNWEIGDDTGTDPLGSSTIILEANSFLVISADTTTLYNVYGPQPYREFPGLASFNNDGDAVQLVTENGTLADSLFYTDDWGGTDVALERRSTSTPSIYKENWGNSPNPDGGTPGLSNEVAQDNTPPQLTDLQILSDQSLELAFDERLETGSASDAANYSVTGPGISSATTVSPDSVELTLDSRLQNAQEYTLTISSVEDIFANAISSFDTTFTYYKVSPVDSGDVAINEFMFAPPENSTEYIELYNHSTKSLDLNGWTLADNRKNPATITDSQFIVPPESFVVIAPDNTLLSEYPGIALVPMPGFPALNNGGDQIIIRNNSGTLLDSLAYNSDWGDEEIAVERRSNTISGIYQNNWGPAPSDTGTPGSQNNIKPDTNPPTLESYTIDGSKQITLKFSEQLGQTTAKNNANFSFANGPAISTANFSAPDSIFLTLGSDLQNATNYTINIKNIADIFGNTAGDVDTSFTFYSVSPVDSGGVFINEFNFQPASGSTEYVEIYNPSDKSFNLQGWMLSDNRGNPSSISDSRFIIPPDSFAVIAPDNTLLSEFPDISLLKMNDFPALNNGGDQIIIRNGSGVLLDSLKYAADWGGEEVPLERRSIDISGVYQNNWGASPDSSGTPGTENKIGTDKTPPKLESLTIAGSNRLTLKFSEQLDASTAENTANFTLANGPEISEASFSPPDSIFLTLGNDLQNATDYTLNIQNVADIFGNTISAVDTSFTFYQISAVDSGDVFINEFNSEPISGSTEYIEIYNPSDKSFDLQGWTLSDNRGNPASISNSQFIIPPDSFAVIAPDNTLLSEFPDISLVTMNDFPSLNNGGDQILIHNDPGALLDSLEYTSEWGGNQVALERRSIEAPAAIRQNWGDAPNDFGTPGSKNEIEPDNTPPFFTNLFATDASTIQLIFSEAITPSTATNSDNYQIKPQRGIQLVLANQDSVALSLDEPMTSGETYEVIVSDISDLLGNTLGGATKEFEYVKIATGQPSDIVINEILYSPNDSQDEFIELYNSSDKNLDLNGWLIGDARSTTSIDQKVQLFADEYLVITADNSFADQIENAITVSGLPALNGGEDAVFIQNPNEITIDSLYYTSKWGSDEDGHSLERKDPLAASNDASNWQTSSSDAGYSAGSQNTVFQPDSTPPEVVFSKVLPDNNIEVRFSEFIRLTDEVRFLAEGQPLNVISFNPDNANTIILESPPAKTKKAGTTITVENLVDIKGNGTAKTKVAVAQPMQQSDLVINEIMYNPLDKPDDNRADQSEYLELRNTQDYAISLEGLVLHDAPDEDGNLRQLHPVTTTAKWVSAQGHVLVYASPVASFNQSQIANFFELHSPENSSIMRVDRSSLSLASSDDAIFIADSTGATIDSVFYGESWQNPNIIDPTGVALERISPNGPSNEKSNWGSSVQETGGTPNNENSIYQKNPQTQQKTGISFSPNPFSPDDDGHEDNLFINYKLDQQDYLIRVRIYDRYGRLVRELADGEQAGFEGQLIWDGRKDDGSRNRIGIYIVVFEAFDSAAGENRSFKETVVLARKLN